MQTQELEILQNKIDHLLNDNALKNIEVVNRIEEENMLMEDFVMPLGKKSPIEFYANGKIRMSFNGLGYELHDNALGQLADKFEIPRKYMKYLNSSEWGRQLSQKVLTEHKENINRNRVLIRTFDGKAKAILSDRYRRLNSGEIYNSFIQAVKSKQAQIYSANYTETKTYMSAIVPRVLQVQTENNGIVNSVFGARISNSDYGDGALDVRTFQMNVVCLNGMVSEKMLNQIHLGKRLPDNINFSDRTYRLDTDAMASAVQDIVGEVLSSDHIIAKANSIKEASSILIDTEKEIKKLPKMGFYKDEVELIQTKLLSNNPEDGLIGKPTKWKLSQAITSVSNAMDTRRKQELDELAGKLISL